MFSQNTFKQKSNRSSYYCTAQLSIFPRVHIGKRIKEIVGTREKEYVI
jgi:hypothetical protein